MAELRTFIFTDIVRSVALKSEMQGRDDTERDRAFIDTILTPHRERIETDLSEHGGRIVSTAGDGHFLVFSDTIRAAQWAMEVQQRHLGTPITTPAGSIVEVRMSLHVGVPQIDPRDPNNFVGKPVDYAARLNDFARGGQILSSRAVAAILEDVQLEGLSLHSHGQRMLRGIGRVEVFELVYREAGPMETLYQPLKHLREDARQWTIIPPGPAGATAAYPAPAAPDALSTAATTVQPPHPRRLGNYELEELLGSGGMGDVYKARHALFDRTRAVKVIKQGLVDAGRTDVIRRFYQEIKAVGKLEHKNIVVAFESSTPEDRVHYLVMEYIDGISLDELVSRHGPLAVPDAAEAIRQAARGLAYIHKHGMVHRDIKPSNLMLTVIERTDTYRAEDSSIGETTQEIPLVKILDLGLALLVDENQGRLTQLGQRAMGTGMYMSPEQWKTTSVDIRADIYSLGCTLYHLLAGRPPFLDSDLKPEKAHEKSRVPPISGPTQVPRKLWDVIRKMLAKAPEDRYQTPDEVAAALAPFCAEHNLVELAHQFGDQTKQDAAEVGTTAMSRPHIETLPIDSKASQPPRWRQRPLATATALALLLVMMALGVWYLRDPPILQSPQLPAAADLVVTLPGLNGSWWFEETPWLTPHERVLLLAGMQESDLDRLRELLKQPDVQQYYDAFASLDLNNAVERARELTGLMGEEPALPQRARDLLIAYDPLLRTVEKDLAASQLQPLLNAIENTAPERRSPATWHILGVLYAHLQSFDEAEQALAQAEARYTEISGGQDEVEAEIAQSLAALVAVDIANLHFSQSEFARAREAFSQALIRLGEAPTPLQVYALGMRSQAGLYDPRAVPDELKRDLDEAGRVIGRLGLDEDHPLQAFLHERRAHFALETWQLPNAIEYAQLAAAKRNRFADLEADPKSLSIRHGTHEAQQGWFRAKQIEALAAHFQGRVSVESPEHTVAWKRFELLLAKLQNSEGIELTDEERITWEQLKPNFHGRMADCELFTMGKFADAARTMSLGIAAAESLAWQVNPEKQHFLVFMHYKRALALALAGDQASAQQVLVDASELVLAIEDKAPLQRFEAYKAVIEALLLSPAEQVVPLNRILVAETQELEDRIRDRDNRQLMLFVAAYLKAIPEPTLTEYTTEAPLPEKNAPSVGDLITQLLEPLRKRQETVGTAYMTLVQQSAGKAVELQWAR